MYCSWSWSVLRKRAAFRRSLMELAEAGGSMRKLEGVVESMTKLGGA